MSRVKTLGDRLRPALRPLEKDLLERSKLPAVEAGLRAAWDAETAAGETGQGFDPWRRARVTQVAAAWVLSVVFVRTLEDRGFIDPRIAGADAAHLAAARDREASFGQIAPFLGPREYLLSVFRELSHLPGAREVFDARHNPGWVLAPSSDGARALIDFFQTADATTGAPVFTFLGADTRFLGDLYQNLSEAVRKRYALLQTPDFVEKFILEQTLAPAIAEFGLAEVRIIDPTCGSGHFLLGAFRDLLVAWQRKEPTTPIEELASRALAQVYGVDINPYAVAIARFRLVLAVLDAVGVKRLDRAPVLHAKVVVADSLLHRMEPQQRLSQQVSMDEWGSWGDALFRLTDPAGVVDVLGERFHAVVGNPPYITEKDAKKRARYRAMYASASGKYALGAPFTERFFNLAIDGGFVGMINSNAWTKREYGKALIETVLPKLDVQRVIDTSGCYLPGHGTPTLLLFGRNRPPGLGDIVAVLGKRGEREVPKGDPSEAPVWREILAHGVQVGFDGISISVEQMTRSETSAHPWVLAGGGARPLLRALAGARGTLEGIASSIGVVAFTLEDAAFVQPAHVHRSRKIPSLHSREMVTGERIRDWEITQSEHVLFPYSQDYRPIIDGNNPVVHALWPSRTVIANNKMFGGKTKVQCGYHWYEFGRLTTSKLADRRALPFTLVTTHFRTTFDSSGRIFERSAPVVKLPEAATDSDYRAVAAFLNSAVTAFWCRLVMFPKGGDQVGDGARLSKTPWQDRLEYGGNQLQNLPIPSIDALREAMLDLVVAVEDTVRQIREVGADGVVASTLETMPTLAALRTAREQTVAKRTRLRGILVSLQEEMDWRAYGLFGLPTLVAASVDEVRVPVAANHRPFEVRLARDVAADISASEWFRAHKRAAPADTGGPLADLYRRRLRLIDDPEKGRWLRLLETPETKRRWAPSDDSKAFTEAVERWLLNRVEAAFSAQPTPEVRTVRQIALELSRDPAVAAAHELLTEDSGHDLVRVLSDLVDAEGVPFLVGYRYVETGLEKRTTWEDTWRLQRLEDEGMDKLSDELKRLGHKAIPIPDKYGPKDFQRHYWRLRGKLDVPKERFITVPGGNADEDLTSLFGWAGWDHLQVAQALAGLYQRRKTEDGWTGAGLVPLLAGIAERVPWMLQWHDEPNAAFDGLRLGQFFRDFVAGEAHTLGVSADDLRKWRPPAATKKAVIGSEEVYAALLAWTPAVDEDDEGEADEDAEETEPPEGPTAEELASDVGATKAVVTKVLKKLVTEGRVEKLDGKPARYVAVGGEA